MINNMWFDNKRIIGKRKSGRKVLWQLEGGAEITSSTLRSQKIEIECHRCKCKSVIGFYGGNNGLLRRRYLCQTCNKSGDRNPFWQKEHSNELKRRFSEKRKGKWHLGRDNPMYGVNVWDTYTAQEREEKRQKISDGQRGSNNQFFGKTHTPEVKELLAEKARKYLADHPDHIAKMVAASLRRQSSGFKSSIERIVEQELVKRKIGHKYNKILHRRFQYDFIIGDDILLEVNGDYWHANPNIYGDEVGLKPLNCRQKFKVEQDRIKRAFAHKYGYKIFYIWETEVRQRDFSVIDLIQGGIKNV